MMTLQEMIDYLDREFTVGPTFIRDFVASDVFQDKCEFYCKIMSGSFSCWLTINGHTNFEPIADLKGLNEEEQKKLLKEKWVKYIKYLLTFSYLMLSCEPSYEEWKDIEKRALNPGWLKIIFSKPDWRNSYGTDNDELRTG